MTRPMHFYYGKSNGSFVICIGSTPERLIFEHDLWEKDIGTYSTVSHFSFGAV